MTVPGNVHALMLGGEQGYKIERSLRFNSADSAYLNRTPASAGNRKTWTWSGWVKRSAINGATRQMFGAFSSTTGDGLFFDSNEKVFFILNGIGNIFVTSQVFRDASAWCHFVLVFDSTSATTTINGGSTDRARFYVNGSQVSAFSSTAVPSQNADCPFINNTNTHEIGRNIGSTQYFDGYLTEVHFIDGQALTPSSFGETDTITGVWKPKKYTGTYGTNGFYLNFSDNSGTTSTTLGKDSSGNGNNWTPNNFSVTAGAGNDSLIDTPTPYADGGNGRGNYCTFNALLTSAFSGGATLKNGNLQVQGIQSAVNTYARGTMAILGKAYAEFFFDVVTSPASIGVVPINDTAADGALYTRSTNVSYRAGGNKRVLGTESAYGASWVANDIIGVAVDPTANTIEFFKNGTSQGVITSSALFAQGNCTFAVATDDIGSPQGYANFGQRTFAHTPPSGFVALNTQNLPEPSIKKPSSYMDVKLYTGNGSTQTISGYGFSPDLVWLKERSAGSSHRLIDTVRGANKELYSDLTNAEFTDTDSLTAFTSNGFSLGAEAGINNNASTYVAWCWNESATPGFDIVTYTGNGTAGRTISHNLGVAPSLIIAKGRTNVDNWPVGHASRGWDRHFTLNTTAAEAVTNTTWNNTAPTSSVFTVGSDTRINQNTITYVAYLWSEVSGFSKFGSYTGNGSTDGPFVYCGFRPKFIMIKASSTTSGWLMIDTSRQDYNVFGPYLLANTSDSETTGTTVFDVLSNGFKMRSASTLNTSSATYIFAAFAEHPFKYALAR